MVTRSTVTLRGDHNQCPTCGELFNSTAAFDQHRVGKFDPPSRRCLTPAEMEEKGMRKTAGGFWKTVSGSQGRNPWRTSENAS